MGDFSDYMYKIIRSYEQNHPNIQIKWVDVPFSEGEKRTLAAVMTDNPPDLINLNPDFSALLAQKGTLEEIDETAVSDFNPEIIKALKYNDKLYSIPWYATSAITIYNKDLFQQSGIIRLPKTYKELSTISEKVKENTGAYAYLPTITENDFSVMNFVIPLRAKHKKEALDFCLYLTNEQNQLELAKMTNVIATNSNALKDNFYNDDSTLEAKARSISARQINKITPQLKQKRGQKEINTLVNSAVQSALLNKDSIENILNKLSRDIGGLEE